MTFDGFVTHKITDDGYVISRHVDSRYDGLYTEIVKDRVLADHLTFLINDNTIYYCEEVFYNIYVDLFYQYSLN